jgi:hypothetical protein
MQHAGRPSESSSTIPRVGRCVALVASAVALAVLSSCVARQRDYRVAPYGNTQYIYPPGLPISNAGPPLEAHLELAAGGAKDAAQDCSVSEDGLRVGSKGASQRGLVASLRLPAASDADYELSAEDSVSPKLRAAFEKLAAADCLRPSDVRPATRQVIENLPLRFDDLLPHHYSYFRGGSSIDLSAGTRLKLQEAIFDETARSPNRSTNPLEGYLGTVSSYYDASEAQDGSLTLRLASVESDVPSEAAGHAAGAATPPALASLKARYLRLLFLGLVVRENTERKAVLLAAEDSRELERMSGAVLENPVGLCGAAGPGPAAKCFAFSGRISTEVEIRIRVNGESRHVLLGTLLQAVAPPAAGVDAAVFAKLKLRRRYNGRLVPVRLPRNDQDALLLPLLADDEIAW